MAEKETMQSLPSYTLGSGDSIDDILEKFRHRLLFELQVMIPAAIVSYDRATHVAIVQPLNNKCDMSGKELQRAPMKVTVIRHYAGRYLLDFPLDEGDTGWVIACDRETSLIKQYNPDEKGEMKGVNIPGTGETHMYHFGYFIPDRWGDKYNTDAEHNAQLTGDAEDAERLVIQSSDGNQKISIRHFDDKDNGEIKITSIDTSDVTKKTTIVIKNGTITIDTSSKINVTSKQIDMTVAESMSVHCPTVTYDSGTAFKIDGTLLVTGDITSQGDVIPSSGFTLNKHKHTGDGGPAVGPTSKPDGNLG